MIRFHTTQPPRNLRDMPESLRFTTDDVARQSGVFDADFSAYYVLRLELAAEGVSVTKLKKPMQTVFGGAQVCFMPIDKWQAYAVVCHPAEDMLAFCNELERACAALTGKNANIGVSMQGSGGDCLPVAFRQADMALEKAFFQPEASVHLFYAETCAVPETTRDGSERLAAVFEAVGRGDWSAASPVLEELFHEQRSDLNPQEIRAEGMKMIEGCGAELDKSDVKKDGVESLQRCRKELPRSPTFMQYRTLLKDGVRGCCEAVTQRLRRGGNAVLDARNYIEANYHRPLSLSDVAAALEVNPGYLSRSFKSKTGFNLVDSINRKKVSVAQELLGRGQMKVSEVAGAVGIEDMAYFSHMFRKYTGMSPREYQKWRLNGEENGHLTGQR